ncbi:hypothetical protein [Dyadobacter sandarakinus]|uniref:Uncharacterized protein n=1 Tax=Dyadobacter sandarakinus TaxID=2747268 RepID=A0ABX7I903_9BACT|nr:hypothetical protein [Dyadobacter sandarakinus]QRR02260.1 hypothetical protein HWI92_15795 [Dyadobacter sandarakinus]
MPDILNSNALNQYATRFTTTVLNEVYRSDDIVTGAGLLKLTPVRQVNLGILNRLFEEWKQNAEAFRSVYFDFSNEEVKEALQAFMNTASQHIAVRRSDLEPLLSASVKESLVLLLTPQQYFEEKIRSGDVEFTTGSAEQLVKYTHIHKPMAEALLARLSDSGSDAVYQTQAVGWVYELKNNPELLDDTETILIEFSDIFPVNLAEIQGTEAGKSVPPVEKQESKSFFDSAFSEADAVAAPPVNKFRTEAGTAVASEVPPRANTYERDTLNSRFKVELPKAKEEDAYAKVPMRVENLASAIPLGQRFMFINQLFNKNTEHFDKAIYELDAVKSYEEAQNLIWHRYASKYAWDVNGEAVTTLLSFVKRKFA